jgi:hydrogenase/urease accessory protein HupE
MTAITLNNTRLTQAAAAVDAANDATMQERQSSNLDAAAPLLAPSKVVAPLPITHQSHPFWSGFSWPVFLHALQIAAVIAPTVVAVADHNDPAAVQTAGQLSGIAGTLAGALLNPQQ